MLRLFGIYALVGLGAISLSGCETTGTAGANASAAFMQAKQDEPVAESKMVAGDSFELSVEVDGAMEVAMHLAKVDARGIATLPLVGEVEVGGLKLGQIREVIAVKYGRFYVSPPVIMISQVEDDEVSEWGRVTVLGKVARPGMVPLTSSRGINLSAAIQNAGGFSVSAKTSDIRITRTSKDGKKIRASVDFERIGQEGNADADLKLVAGDMIYVPERIF
jgi:protein involved in polysaccharide export with SLBB domain